MAEFVWGKKGDETFQEYRDRAINSLSCFQFEKNDIPIKQFKA